MTDQLEASERADSFAAHRNDEPIVELGEIRMNYATTGDDSRPALPLIPALVPDSLGSSSGSRFG
ncbi:MAG: hypothetical protein OES13_09175, partial [Acidimicrobiia bacterium]|nr:hypothetical protein [Acidimicrobiia bacterium]